MTQEADPDSYYPEIRPQACHGIVCDTSYVTFQLHMHTALQIRCCVLFRDLHFKAEWGTLGLQYLQPYSVATENAANLKAMVSLRYQVNKDY